MHHCQQKCAQSFSPPRGGNPYIHKAEEGVKTPEEDEDDPPPPLLKDIPTPLGFGGGGGGGGGGLDIYAFSILHNTTQKEKKKKKKRLAPSSSLSRLLYGWVWWKQKKNPRSRHSVCQIWNTNSCLFSRRKKTPFLIV